MAIMSVHKTKSEAKKNAKKFHGGRVLLLRYLNYSSSSKKESLLKQGYKWAVKAY